MIITAHARARGASAGARADVVVIDADAIRNTSADSIEDLIRRSAGMQVVRNGGPGQTSGFFIRGASTNSTVVLIDGVRVGSATLGQAEFEALSLAQIERIEILRGPASSLYGADAVGGVVQIFTRRGEGAPRWTAAGEVGGYRSLAAATSARAVRRRLGLRALARPRESRGVSAIAPGDRSANSIPTRRLQARVGNAATRLRPGAGSSHRRTPARDAGSTRSTTADSTPPSFADPRPISAIG